jgi:predicted unusual protein kinase regulating ubiquinone biosynthesis (AarF/ABC1/UbiB family)
MQLRMALEKLGPRYSCLALYLSSRIDLLPAEYCRELALAIDAAPALPPAEIQRLLINEFGDASPRCFASFDYTTQRSTLTRQFHSARLTTGDLVTVMFLRPEYYPLQNEKEQKEFLDWDLVRELCRGIAIQEAMVDFRRALRRKANLLLESDTAESPSHNNHQSDFNRVRERKIYHELSTARVLTVKHEESESLDGILASGNCSLKGVARRICKVWLKQAMSGGPFPVDLQAHHLLFGRDDQISFAGCELATLPHATAENLWNYLLAALVDDPDRSAMYLLEEMYRAGSKEVDLESFRTNFRQAAYFAALEPILGTDSNALPQLVFQHWRTALDHGYIPKPLLLCFYRGLFSVARIARNVSPIDDAMRDGMEDLQAERIFDQVRELAGPQYWMQNADKFARVLVNLPRTFDQALTRTSRPPQEIVIQDGSDSRPYNLATVIAIFLLIVAFLIAESAHLSGLPGKIVTGVLMLAGLLTLRALSG